MWALPIGEPDPELGTVILTSKSPGAPRFVTSLTARGAYGRWLRLPARFGEQLNTVEGDEVIDSLITVLAKHGLVTQVRDRGVTGWRLNAGALAMYPGDGTKGSGDPVRRSFEAEAAPRVVPFFRDLYRDAAVDLAGLHALEHTAQVPAAEREDRETKFRAGTLPLLFCSPTMELGVDISSLNAVAMRNVPPTPANYAQRSGRAGRSGQQAIVVTYCSSGNAHDTYYFNRSNLMVAGQVQPPRLDLANADLVRSHVHAVWLAEVLAGDSSRPGPLPVRGARPDRARNAGPRRSGRPDGRPGRRRPGQRHRRPPPVRPCRRPRRGLMVGPGLDRRRDQFCPGLVRCGVPALARAVHVGSRREERRPRAELRHHGQPEAARGGPPPLPGGVPSGRTAAQRVRRRRAERLLHLPLPGQRGVPAGLLVPPPAVERVHPRVPRQGLRVAATRPLPGHQRVRPRRADLPRGLHATRCRGSPCLGAARAPLPAR